MRLVLDAADLPAGDARAEQVRMCVSLERVERATKDASFEEAFGALSDEFAARGELERRAVVERWLARPVGSICLPFGSGPDLDWQYVLVVARAPDGTLAGVRDAHVTIDRAARTVVVYLAHTLVMPAHRRSGLGALLRAAPIAIARRAAGDLGLARAEILACAEMERPDPDDESSLVRLVAYGAAGFAAIPRSILPYEQPDFRDPDAIGVVPEPLPLLAVVRREAAPGPHALRAPLARAFVDHLYAVFATHCRAEHLAPSLRRMREALDAWGARPVPLAPLPRSTEDRAAIEALVGDA